MNDSTATARQRGVTLLELLVVVAILVAVAAIGTRNLSGAIDESKVVAARTEMLRIAAALRQFKQDTGYYPGQGPFDLVANGGSVPEANLPPVAGTTTAERSTWLHSPANFWALYRNPLDLTGHVLENWNPVSARGWRGPYLQSSGEGLVDLSDDLISDGTGDPVETTGAAALVAEVAGVSDPFDGNPVDVATTFDADGALLDWRSQTGAAVGDDFYLGDLGGPYFVFDLDNAAFARVVSMGPDGAYEGVNGVDPCLPGDLLGDGRTDDIVVCLE